MSLEIRIYSWGESENSVKGSERPLEKAKVKSKSIESEQRVKVQLSFLKEVKKKYLQIRVSVKFRWNKLCTIDEYWQHISYQ